jgi:uncharacterized protein DUF4136
MHIRFLIMWLTLTPLTAGGCVAPDVRTDFDSSAEFSAFRTFAFTGLTDTDQGGVLDNSLLRKRIEEMVRQQMTAKGLRQVDLEEHPDLLVHFWVGVKEKERVESTGPTVGPYPGPYAGPYAGRGYGTVTTYEYKEGTLIIDLMTPAKNDLVWRGSIVGILSNSKEENMQLANQGIIKAFEDYPPKGKTH